MWSSKQQDNFKQYEIKKKFNSILAFKQSTRNLRELFKGQSFASFKRNSGKCNLENDKLNKVNTATKKCFYYQLLINTFVQVVYRPKM